LFALEAANSIVDTVLDAIVAGLDALKQILFGTWDIPFVSDLYASITNQPLTVADLGALLVAIPGTAIYKIVTGEAPFPTADSVTQFETAFTAQNLLVQAGFGPSAAAKPGPNGAAVATAGAVPVKLVKAWGILYGINMVYYGAVEARLDKVEAKTDPLSKRASIAALVLEFTGQLFSVPWIAGPSTKGLGCTGTEEFGNLVWFLQWLEVGIDVAFLIFDD